MITILKLPNPLKVCDLIKNQIYITDLRNTKAYSRHNFIYIVCEANR